MNTLQIERLLKKDLKSKTIFKKVCALDQLEKPTFPSAYVINSDPSSKPGEHWVAVYFDKRGRGEYFDSYGLPPYLGRSRLLHGCLLLIGMDLQSQNLTSVLFQFLWSLLCLFYFISLSWRTFACYCI